MTDLTAPSATLRRGSSDRAAIRHVQQRLNALGCGPIDVDGDYGKQTEKAVRLFQARFADRDGLPLKIDGTVGPITWHALFNAAPAAPRPAPPPVTLSTPADALLRDTLAVAVKEIGTREDPLGSNRGPKVDVYLRSVGLDPAKGSYAWCAAFVYWCFGQASDGLGRPNPAVRTAGVLDHWRKAGERGIRRFTTAEAVETPGLVRGGQIFVIGTGGITGHMGLVEGLDGGKLVTIEGNSNEGGSREGIGVFRRTQRKIGEINKGFIDYATS